MIDDPSIAEALEERDRRKMTKDDATKLFRASDDIARAKLLELELPDGGAVRVGRFRITRRDVPARTVEPFETKASTRIRITPVKG